MPFVKGKRHPRQGGRQNPPGGRPTNKEIAKKKAEVEGLQKIYEGFLKGLGRQGVKFGEKLKKDLMKHPNLLMTFFKALLDKIEPDARQEVDIQHRHSVIYETIDPNEERRRKRIADSQD